MRLSQKLSLFTALCTALVLSGYGYFVVRREITGYEDDVRRDHSVLGNAIAIGARFVAAHDGADHAVAFIEDADSNISHVLIHWAPRSATTVVLENDRPTSVVEQEYVGGNRFITTHVPISLGERGEGFVVLSEELWAEQQETLQTIVGTVLSILVIISFSTLGIIVLVWSLLGRPLQEVMEMVQRVASGDLSGRLRSDMGGEMGMLARELNEMCEQLESAREKIERETMARMATLEQLRHADRLGTVGKLAAGIAHELGTPLTVVTARARRIERGESSGEAAVAEARIVREQAERMAHIIRQLLDFARRRPLKRQQEDLDVVVQRAIGLLEPLAGKQGVAIEYVSPEHPRTAEVDGVQIEQVVTNLLMNAIQAQPHGGVARVKLGQEGGATAEALTLEVEDQGNGMTPDVLERVFEPFFTTKDVGSGTGLGLSVVYGIIEEHGGRIDAASEPGQGSRFTVTLPTRPPS
jgi:signal transduction histidine kinase